MSGKLNSLLVAIPLGELGYSRYWQQLMTHRDFGYMIFTRRVISQSGAYPHQAMNDLVKEALKIPGWERLAVLEHDHTYPAGFLRKLAGYKEDIVSGLYTLRDIEEPLPVIYDWDSLRQNLVIPNAERLNHMLQNPGLHEVDVVPLGCCSIRRDVLEEWDRTQPYFSSYSNPVLATITHDVFFSRLAQDQGHKLFVDTSLLVTHYTQVEVDIHYFLRWFNQVGAKKMQERMEQVRERELAGIR